MQFLQQGKIDLMIATMNDTPERRKAVGIVEPDYYASGVNVMSSKKAALKNWEQIKARRFADPRRFVQQVRPRVLRRR